MANLSPKQAQNLYALKTTKFRREPAPAVDPIADAAIISDKVKSSSCFGAVAAVIVVVVVVIGGVL